MRKQSEHIKKDDRAIVLSGKEKGKIGKVLKILPKKNRAVIEKVNMVKRHTRAGAKAAKGGIIEREGSLHISNLMLICPKCTDPVRVGHKVLEDGSWVRVCKKCGETLDE
ncbi:MAG: 50S ribosomal protein L24 [Deltaproteobacteria bacterium]|nr:50S ribosomal protein L24 [Deltaproteobacteria bacterium]MBW2085583.1 50S ribosomal protein L24 [Deltaproteobacteria bacterium]